MVSKAAKEHMLEFVQTKVRGVERIVEDDWLILSRDGPTKRGLILHPFKRTQKQYKSLLGQLSRAGYDSIDIFYQDEETFFKRLDSRARGRSEASLKKYSLNDLNAMLILRDIERMSTIRNSNKVTYFHPESPQIPECLRIYNMKPVTLDYTHLPIGDIARSRGDWVKSESYRIPVELKRVI